MTKPSRKGTTLPPRPHQWLSGPDPAMRPVFRAFTQCRNQAQWRGEDWQLSWQQWLGAWHGLWHRRGRSADALCITRKDCGQAWSEHNVIIITRRQNGERKRGTHVSLGQGPADVVLDDTWATKPLTQHAEFF